MKAQLPAAGDGPNAGPPVKQSGFRREFVPVAVLLVGALTFAVAVHTHNFTTWTGPGFSMFSTVDYDRTRWVRIEVTTAEASAPAQELESTDELLESLKARPDDSTALALATAYLNGSWALIGTQFEPGAGSRAESVSLTVVNVYVAGSEIVAEELLTMDVAR